MQLSLLEIVSNNISLQYSLSKFFLKTLQKQILLACTKIIPQAQAAHARSRYGLAYSASEHAQLRC